MNWVQFKNGEPFLFEYRQIMNRTRKLQFFIFGYIDSPKAVIIIYASRWDRQIRLQKKLIGLNISLSNYT